MTDSRRQVVMFLYGDLTVDARVRRSAQTLREAGYDVTVISLTRSGPGAYEHRLEGTVISLPAALRGVLPGDPTNLRRMGRRSAYSRIRWLMGYVRAHASWSRRASKLALEATTDAGTTVWHAHDLTGLLPALRAAKRHRGLVIYDSHELFVDGGSAAKLPSMARRLLARYEGRMARKTAAVITVSDGIADELSRRYHLPRPTVIRNCPRLGPEPVRRAGPLRTELGLGDRPVLLYHGYVVSARGIPEAVKALDQLPEEVAFVVLGDGELVPDITQLATERFRGRLFVHPAVPLEELPKWVAGADIGMVTIPQTSTNHRLALPNKLFECLAAGVPVVASNSDEMATIVRGNSLGTTCDPTNPTAIATAVKELLALDEYEREQMSIRCRKAAELEYSWEQESVRLLDLYERVAWPKEASTSRSR